MMRKPNRFPKRDYDRSGERIPRREDRDSGFKPRGSGGFKSRSDRFNAPRKFQDREGGFKPPRFADRSAGFDRSEGGLHEVICANCGKETTVPFKPSGKKPVLCRNCFGRSEAGRPVARTFDKAEKPGVDLSEINRKLDKIIKLLEE